MSIEVREGGAEERKEFVAKLLKEQMELLGQMKALESLPPEESLVLKLRLLGNNLNAVMNMGNLGQRHALVDAIICTMNAFVVALEQGSVPVTSVN